MNIIDIGEKKPEAFVIGAIHGDEKCGPKAIRKILNDKLYPSNLSIRFIIANERALYKSKRYIDCDLNRAFPGDKDSDKHEEVLAHDIWESIDKKSPLLSLHSSVSTDKVFAIVSSFSESIKKIVSYINTDKIVLNNKFHLGNLSLELGDNCIELECGMKGKEETVENAVNETVSFLRAVNNNPKNVSKFDVYKLFKVINGESYTPVKENFSLVEEGDVFARKGKRELVSDEDFYPVLMSENGYKDKLGFKSRKLYFPNEFNLLSRNN